MDCWVRGCGHLPDARTPAREGPAFDCGFTTRRSEPIRRSSPARWRCAGVLTLHITSFRSREPYRTTALSVQERRPPCVRPRRAARPRRRSRRAPRAPVAGSGRRPAPVSSAGPVTRGRPGSRPVSWIQRLSGVSHLATVRRNAAGVVGQRLPLLDGALAERRRRRPASPVRVSWSAPATISLADALPAVDQHDDLDRGVRRDARRAPRRSRPGRPRVLLPEDRTPSAMNSLATSRAAVTKPPGLPRRSRMSFFEPASRSALRISSSSSAAPASQNPASRT